jgi:hypothetical protein
MGRGLHARKARTAHASLSAAAAIALSSRGGDRFREIMNSPNEMESEEVLRVQLEVLRREHRDLDQAIHALQESGLADQLALRRLKKQKLVLKDRIAVIEDRLTPDIIA